MAGEIPRTAGWYRDGDVDVVFVKPPLDTVEEFHAMTTAVFSGNGVLHIPMAGPRDLAKSHSNNATELRLVITRTDEQLQMAAERVGQALVEQHDLDIAVSI